MKAIHLSDLHFGREDEAAIRETEAHIRAEGYDVILVSGDLTQSGRRHEFEAAASWLSRLPGPKLLTVGNHDFPVFNVLERVRKPFKRFLALVHSDPDMHIHRYYHPLCRFVTLRTAHALQWRRDWSLGAVHSKHLKRSLQDLNQGTEPWRIVMGHHPLRDAYESPVLGRVRKGDDALRALHGAGADLVLSGHIHEPFFAVEEPEAGFPAAAGTGTISTRLRNAPPSFNRLLISADEIVIETVSMGGGVSQIGRISKAG